MQLLIRILKILVSSEKGLNSLGILTKVLGNKRKFLFKLIKGLNAKQEEELIKRFGANTLKQVKKSVGVNKKHEAIPKTYVKSSWIEYISWSPVLGILTLKTIKSAKIYKLPFCKRTVAERITTNKSPGKALWNGYWRVVGKGKVSNKIKNLSKVKSAQQPVKLIPSIPKITRARIVTKNVPRTKAKGIRIYLRKPRVTKRRK